jgi:hypothetical protein
MRRYVPPKLGSYKSHTASHPRRRHCSYSPPWKPQFLLRAERSAKKAQAVYFSLSWNITGTWIIIVRTVQKAHKYYDSSTHCLPFENNRVAVQRNIPLCSEYECAVEKLVSSANTSESQAICCRGKIALNSARMVGRHGFERRQLSSSSEYYTNICRESKVNTSKINPITGRGGL